jgi:N6-adenosine-specific RNA methylase IME4
MKIDRELLRRLPRALRIEVEENLQRKDFPPSELAAVWRAIEAHERTAAKARQGERTDRHAGNLSRRFGRARDKIGAVAGVSGRTLQKIVAVVAAAEAEPERFDKLVEYMDQTGSVDRAFKQLQTARHQDEHAERAEQGCTVADLTALAESGKRFGVIYADPPWPWGTWGPRGKVRSSPDHHYTESPIAEIAALPVAALAADNCVLFLWCTWPYVAIGTHVGVIEAWGFRPCTLAFDWVKQTPSGDGLHWGMGYYTRSNSEPCLIAVKGSPTRLATDVHQIVMAPVGEHSEKPEEVRARIERLFVGPYLELYGRRPVPGWTVWGNEIARDGFAQISEAAE